MMVPQCHRQFGSSMVRWYDSTSTTAPISPYCRSRGGKEYGVGSTPYCTNIPCGFVAGWSSSCGWAHDFLRLSMPIYAFASAYAYAPVADRPASPITRLLHVARELHPLCLTMPATAVAASAHRHHLSLGRLAHSSHPTSQPGFHPCLDRAQLTLLTVNSAFPPRLPLPSELTQKGRTPSLR